MRCWSLKDKNLKQIKNIKDKNLNKNYCQTLKKSPQLLKIRNNKCKSTQQKVLIEVNKIKIRAKNTFLRLKLAISNEFNHFIIFFIYF